MQHPYKDLPDHCFWPKAMSALAPGHIDPVTRSKRILPGEPVATMGSCFAQHLARHIGRSGLNYYVAEQAPTDLGADEAKRRNFGVFSARYGTVYTVRQAVQLFDRAFDRFQPAETAWQRRDGRWVDPFRPQVGPTDTLLPMKLRLPPPGTWGTCATSSPTAGGWSSPLA